MLIVSANIKETGGLPWKSVNETRDCAFKLYCCPAPGYGAGGRASRLREQVRSPNDL